MSNQLIYETTPYFLQHAENSVNWHPWCEEAFTKAKAENKPFLPEHIFLLIHDTACRAFQGC